MNQTVNAISGRLSLRPPQRESLERLHWVMDIAHPKHGQDMSAALEVIGSEFPTVTDFERAFPSLCFALATGVGKTRLMGAFISYLHLEHGICNFFVLAPNLTIYNKLIGDFTENTPKYVFKGIHAFAAEPPQIITGDNYEQRDPLSGRLLGQVQINIFNVAKISSEVRGGRSPRIRRLSEYIGESYFDYLAGLGDLVMLMDESHRYRASAGMRAINELKPILGLELTATPFIETSRGPVQFKNVIYEYPLARAMEDGFVKEPAVVTQKDFDPSRFSQPQLEQVKLEDGVRLHERLKVELETYARQNGVQIVKPFVLVIARDTTHARQLLALIESDAFFEGRYKDKVIQVDSSKKGTAAEEIAKKVQEETGAYQPDLAGLGEAPRIADILAKTTELVVERTIDIPRILVVPKGDVNLGFNPFRLDLSAVNFEPVDRDLLIQHLRTHQQERITATGSIATEKRLEDYLVRGLIDFDDISYDDHADLLYDLAGQVVSRLMGYLDEEDARNVLQYYERQLVELTHTQMQAHQRDGEIDYEVAKFDSDSERLFSVVVENDPDVHKWFRPAKGQFQLFYKSGVDHREYQPDFVVETQGAIYMYEPKQRRELKDPEVLAKKEAAERWCARATAHTAT